MPLPPPLLKLRQIDRIAAWPTDATVQGIFDDERAQCLVLIATKDVDEERLRLGMLAACTAAAEAARSEGRTLARPAVHPSISPCRRAQPGLNIMRRSGAKFACFFTRGAHQALEVLSLPMYPQIQKQQQVQVAHELLQLETAGLVGPKVLQT